MKKRILALLLVLMLATFPLLAIFGVGDIVHDPISYANALLMLAQLIKNYEQVTAQLELEIWMSQTVPVDMATRYRTIGTAWYGLETPSDRFGKVTGWLQAVNEAGSAAEGYSAATVELRPYGAAFSKLAVDEQLKTASRYASVELADGINIHSMETVGMLRGNAAIEDQSIAALEEDALSLDPAMNTEIAVLNKINASSIAALRSSRDTNRALLSVLEQQVVDSKARRDAHVAEIGVHIKRLELGEAAKAARAGTITQSLQSFRWK